MWNILSASSPESSSSTPGFSLLLSFIPSYPFLDSLSSSLGFPLLLDSLLSFPGFLSSVVDSLFPNPDFLLSTSGWFSLSWIPSNSLQDFPCSVVDSLFYASGFPLLLRSLCFAPCLLLFWIPSPELLDSHPPVKDSLLSSSGFPLLRSWITSFQLDIPSPLLVDSLSFTPGFSLFR